MIRRNLLSFLLFLVTGLVLAACSPVQVNYDYDPGADFRSIHTYGWEKVDLADDALAREPLLRKRIVEAVDSYLQGRGYRRVSRNRADVLVVIHGGFKEKMRVTNWEGPGYWGSCWYDPWWRGGRPHGRHIDVSYYTEGTLVIDIVDREKAELVWRGLGTAIVHPYSSPEESGKAVYRYVCEILERFPPGHEKEAGSGNCSAQ